MYGKVIVGWRNKSGMGLPHSTTLARSIAPHSFREVVECGSPMPLLFPFPGRRRLPLAPFYRFNASTFQRLPFQTCNLPESLLSFPYGLLVQ
jgi:hypothetical protein